MSIRGRLSFLQRRDLEIFCWNSGKAATNFAEHGIAFEHAREVFADIMLLIDDAPAAEEARFVASGLTLDWKLSCVVHLVREDNFIRILSARPADVSERNRYEDNA